MRFYLTLLFITLSCHLIGQTQSDYNRQGDEAMKRQNYRDARMWYEEGLPHCDIYSISKLTEIWISQETRRGSMHSAMIRCLSCLNNKAAANDTTAIRLLITYYSEGIGTQANNEQALYWQNRIEKLHTPEVDTPITQKQETKRRPPMRFFAGYSYSMEAPFGLTIGGVWDKYGWYGRFKTNLSFEEFTYQCTNEGVIQNTFPNQSYRLNKNIDKEINTLVGTAGFLFKITSSIYTSVGVGYGQRSLIYPFVLTDYQTGKEEEVWCKNIDASTKGMAAEVDLWIRFNSFFISAGCHSINFEYIDLNAGIGFIF